MCDARDEGAILHELSAVEIDGAAPIVEGILAEIRNRKHLELDVVECSVLNVPTHPVNGRVFDDGF